MSNSAEVTSSGDTSSGGNTHKKRRSTDTARNVRVVVLGIPGVGKSAITVRFLTKRFIGEYDEFLESKQSLVMPVDLEMVNFEILDTCSRGPDGSVKEEHLKWADGVLLVFDLTQLDSFLAIKPMYSHALGIKKVSHLPGVVVGNKVDMQHHRMVEGAKGERLGASLGCPYVEISAADDYTGVQDALLTLYKEVRAQRRRSRTLFDRIFKTNKK